MFEFIKNLFKKEIKEIPGVERVKVARVPIKRINVTRTEVKKFEPKRFEPKTFGPRVEDSNRWYKVYFHDTDEIVDVPFEDDMKDILGNGRPVTIIGYVQ